MRALAIVAAAIAVGPQAAQAIGVHVEPGALTASVTAALIAERPAIRLAPTPEAADVRVAIRALDGPDGRAVEVVADTASGARLVERRLAQPDGLAPVLRLIVLLVAEALDALDAPPPDTAAPAPRTAPDPPRADPDPPRSDTDPPRPLPPVARALTSSRLRLGASAGGWWWAVPATPQVELAARVGWALEPLSLDLRLAAAPCCALAEPGIVDGTPLSLSALVDGSWAFYSAEPIQLLASAAAGIGYRRVSGFARAFVGAPGEDTQAALEALLRAALGGAWRLADRWALELRAGAELRPSRLRISLPPPYTGGTNAVDPGVIAPFFELAVIATIF